MSEYIDRQALYDAIRNACSMTGEDYHKCDGYSETRTRCDELGAETYEDGFNDGYYEGWKEGQEALRREMWERERDRLD